MDKDIEVSVILPVHNGEQWLDECLQSVFNQTFPEKLELSIYNDNSTDRSALIIEAWRGRLEARGVRVVVGGHTDRPPGGVGYAKNRAISQSSGKYLCFLDADDAMHPERISRQYTVACQYPQALIGSRFHRLPPGSTERYSRWANNLTDDQLYTQIYTSHGPTIIMPTWFCRRETFQMSGPWDEGGQGTPEDLLFFLRHVEAGGQIIRLQEDLLMYRYHPSCTTFSVHEDTIWDIRLSALERHVLSKWPKFTIWNAGKQGRKLYRSLSSCNQVKVIAFCDVDPSKLAKGYYTYEESEELPKPRIPIVHFTQATPPLVICVKQDLTGGRFEENLASLGLHEGRDYFHFN